ncbi:MAG: lysine--tRNA ligase [Calditrichaeota bacterium]|nr:lysine--tRNA ligase [Calditrichota bacterium]
MPSHDSDTPIELPPAGDDLDHILRARREKLARIRELGIDPYPPGVEKVSSTADLLAQFDALADAETPVAIAGRLMSIRLMGKAAFCDLQDASGRLQVYLKKDVIGDDIWELFSHLDIGDIVRIGGHLFITRTGQQSLQATSLTLLTKSLRPLPAVKEKGDQTWYGWEDREERYRDRSLDLILNRDSRDTLIKRSRIVRELRLFFEGKGFVEIETPVLQPLYGGALARPFITHHNTLDRDLYLRIADELYLKRVIVGGIPRVYEIAKDFRNEGIDRMHSPEFTMLEAYAAYADYEFAMELMEELFPRLARVTVGSEQIRWEGVDIDLTPPYRRLPMSEGIKREAGIDVLTLSRDELAVEARNKGLPVDPSWGSGKIIDELFSAFVQPNLIQPIFVTDHPVALSPLAKRHRRVVDCAERFELYIGGLELVNAFSELNDPLDQRARFEEQARLRAAGDDEMPPIDEDFLAALELGMPPTAGLGIGVDRLAMVLTGSTSIRDVILFPLLRPRSY